MSASTMEFTVAEIAERVGGRVVGNAGLRLTGVSGLGEAGPADITFLGDVQHARRWPGARAGCAVVTEGLEPGGHDGDVRALIVVPSADLAIVSVIDLFKPSEPRPEPGVHPTAWVHPSARLGRDVRIGPQVTIDRDADIGDDVVLHAGARVYPDVTIGSRSVLHANCVIREGSRIGSGVLFHQGVSIGADGFGYRFASDGSGVVKVPHASNVIIEDDVEIGANASVDRGKFAPTIVGANTKIDNLVQISHNCRIGRSCLLAAGTVLAGSVVLGDRVVLGGGVAIAEHRRIGDGVMLAALSGVMHDIPAGERWGGVPAAPMTRCLRQWAAVRRLPGLLQRISRLGPTGTREVRPADAD